LLAQATTILDYAIIADTTFDYTTTILAYAIFVLAIIAHANFDTANRILC
jgi:hypothetical protein